MKKLIYLVALGLLVNIGCTKEQSADPKEGSENLQESIYVYNIIGETSSWEVVSADAMQISSNQNSAEKSNSNSAHTHGNLEGFITFSGTQNNGGTHGSAEIQTSSFHIILETASVVIIGEDENQAVYGGLVTEVIFNNVTPPPPPPPCPTFPNCPPPPPPPACPAFGIGTYVYFSVIDNGQGNNADADAYSPLLYPSCDELSDGGASFPWGLFGLISLDPTSNDKIKVN